jgi:hypothetical protein
MRELFPAYTEVTVHVVPSRAHLINQVNLRPIQQ